MKTIRVMMMEMMGLIMGKVFIARGAVDGVGGGIFRGIEWESVEPVSRAMPAPKKHCETNCAQQKKHDERTHRVE